MIFHETELIKKSREYAEGIFQKLPDHFYYHNLSHTEQVAAAAVEIGEESDLSVHQLELVIIAAWFHDLGYSTNIDDHEEESIMLMQEQMKEWGVSFESINSVADIIRSTKIPQTPQNIESKVICDADLYHLADTEYLERSEDLLREINAIKRLDISTKEWHKMSIEFLEKHNYFTPYAQHAFGPKKKMNLEILKNRY